MFHKELIEYMENSVIPLLSEHFICIRCIGRLLAGLGTGLDNRIRGEAILTLLTMNIDYSLKSETEKVEIQSYKKIAENTLYKPLLETLKKYGHELTVEENKKCVFCGSNLDRLIDHFVKESLERLKEVSANTFLVAIKHSEKIIAREEEIVRRYKLKYYELMERELKREVGKKISELTGLQPDFQKPDVIILLDLDAETVNIKPMNLYILGRYFKVGRNISQIKWMYKNDHYHRRISFSIEEALIPLIKMFKGSKVKLHAAGREDVDVRMLGTGRPVVIEVKEALNRNINLEDVERVLNAQHPYIKFKLIEYSDKKTLRKLKIESPMKSKIYRALIYSPSKLSAEEVRSIEEYFRNVTVVQRTPKRVRHRRADIVRRKIVHEVKMRIVDHNLVESIIYCQGGLYVKELISGDGGDTSPSFSEILGKDLECIELDVLLVS